MVGSVARESLERFISANPAARGPLGALLDRFERAGRLPARMTLDTDREASRALVALFSERAVAVAGEGRLRLDLARCLRTTGLSESELVAALYRALDRAPKDQAASGRALRAEIERALIVLQNEARSDLSKTFIEHQLAELRARSSELALRGDRDGAAGAVEHVRQAVRCLDALGSVQAPMRIQNFAARVLGSSKALRPGSELLRTVATALVDHDPVTRRRFEEQGTPPFRAAEIGRALEVNGIYQDEAAASVLCFGALIYRKRGFTFDHVARHAAFGEASRLILHQLRDVEFERPEARRITIFENLTPFLDYVDRCVEGGSSDEIVLCSGGQANFAVVAVLAGLAEFDLPVRHSGDLDRSGVLILRSLKRRSSARIEPLLMDAPTHARFAHLGQLLSREEQGRLEQLLSIDGPEDPCHDLLHAVHRSKVWVEQEQFSAECLEQMVRS